MRKTILKVEMRPGEDFQTFALRVYKLRVNLNILYQNENKQEMDITRD